MASLCCLRGRTTGGLHERLVEEAAKQKELFIVDEEVSLIWPRTTQRRVGKRCVRRVSLLLPLRVT